MEIIVLGCTMMEAVKGWGKFCSVMVRTGTSGNIPYCNACSVTDSTIPHTSVTPVPTSVPGGSSVRR